MNQLRMALGARRINYYGVSYGTVLGSVYRQLFPSHVRSMVLDGAVDANLSLTTDATLEAPAIQAAVEYELGRCTASPGCPLGADPVTFYKNLEQRLARSPLPAPGGGDTHTGDRGRSGHGHPPLSLGPEPHPGYFPALAAAAAGHGRPAADAGGGAGDRPQRQVTGRPARGPSPATTPPPTPTPAPPPPWPVRWPPATRSAGPRRWPTISSAVRAGRGAQQTVAHLHPNQAPTPLVIGNTGDPNTPYAGARALTAAIGGTAAHLCRLRALLDTERIDQRLYAEGGRRLLRERHPAGPRHPLPGLNFSGSG